MRLRIVGGEMRGRFFQAPKSDATRPTTERVKESLFNTISNFIDFGEIDVLDLYAGSGSLGFECVSRGAASVQFVEKNFAVYKNLEKNIESLGVQQKTSILKMTSLQAVKMSTPGKFALILADPPFFEYDIYEVTETILARKLLAPEGYYIIERSKQTIEKDTEHFKCEPWKRIGDTCLYLFENAG